LSERRLFLADDLELALPPGFVDKSAQLLEWQVEGGQVALGIQRDTSPKRLRAGQLADKLRLEYERRLSERVDEEFPMERLTLALEHRILAMRWRREGQSVFQVQAFVEHVDRLLILTASGEARLRAFISELMLATLNDLELREPDV
jgi:hypothetical protein